MSVLFGGTNMPDPTKIFSLPISPAARNDKITIRPISRSQVRGWDGFCPPEREDGHCWQYVPPLPLELEFDVWSNSSLAL